MELCIVVLEVRRGKEPIFELRLHLGIGFDHALSFLDSLGTQVGTP